MKWQGGEESENLEDRRGIGPKGIAVGGGIGLGILNVGTLLGVNPDLLNHLVGNAQGPPGMQQQQDQGPVNPRGGDPRGLGGRDAAPAPQQRDRAHHFSAVILKYTEDVWTDQFEKAGK